MAGLTQRELADKAAISQQFLSKLEAGERKLAPSLAIALARLLACRPAELLPDLALWPQPDTEGEVEIELLRRWRRLGPNGRALLLEMAETIERLDDAF